MHDRNTMKIDKTSRKMCIEKRHYKQPWMTTEIRRLSRLPIFKQLSSCVLFCHWAVCNRLSWPAAHSPVQPAVNESADQTMSVEPVSKSTRSDQADGCGGMGDTVVHSQGQLQGHEGSWTAAHCCRLSEVYCCRPWLFPDAVCAARLLAVVITNNR